MNKKGDLLDITEMSIIAVVSILIIFIMYLIISNFNSELQSNNSSLVPDVSKNISQNYTNKYKAFDFFFPLLLASIMGASIFIVRQYPEYNSWVIPISVVALIVLGFLGMIAENIYNSLTDNVTINAVASNFPITDFTMNYYVVIVILSTVIITIAGVVRNE